MCLSLKLHNFAFELSSIDSLLKNKTSYFIKIRKILLLFTNKSKFLDRINEKLSETKYSSKEKNSKMSKIEINSI